MTPIAAAMLATGLQRRTLAILVTRTAERPGNPQRLNGRGPRPLPAAQAAELAAIARGERRGR